MQQRHQRQLREREQEAIRIHQGYSTNRRPASREEAVALAEREAAAYSDADRKKVRSITAELKQIRDQMRREIDEACREAAAPDQPAVANTVRGCGGRLTHTFHIQNAVSALLPGTAIRTVADHPLVAHVVEDARTEAELNISAQAINCATFWNAGQRRLVLECHSDTGSIRDIPRSPAYCGGSTSHIYTARPILIESMTLQQARMISTGTPHVAATCPSEMPCPGIAYAPHAARTQGGIQDKWGGGGMYQSDAMDASAMGLSTPPSSHH